MWLVPVPSDGSWQASGTRSRTAPTEMPRQPLQPDKGSSQLLHGVLAPADIEHEQTLPMAKRLVVPKANIQPAILHLFWGNVKGVLRRIRL